MLIFVQFWKQGENVQETELVGFELGKLTDTNGCTMEKNTKLKQGSQFN